MTYGDGVDEGQRINAIKKRVGYVETLMHMSGQLEFIGYRLCDLVDTLREIDGKLCEPQSVAEARAMFHAHAADLRQTLSEHTDRELGEITLTNVVPETEDDKQGLGKWLEQLDKCKCPIQVRIVHEDCCEHREQNEHT